MPDILLIGGLCCGPGTQKIFVDDLSQNIGKEWSIWEVDPSTIDRSSTEKAIQGIVQQFQHLHDPIIIGYSLGGLWAIFLARANFTRHVISISPSLPGNMFQLDPLRLSIFKRWLFADLLKHTPFGKWLPSARPFRFNEDQLRRYIWEDLDSSYRAEVMLLLRDEPSSLIMEYAYMRQFIRLSPTDIDNLREDVEGLIITGSRDQICKSSLQTRLAEMLGFRQSIFYAGHSPHLGVGREQVLREILEFLEGYKRRNLVRKLGAS